MGINLYSNGLLLDQSKVDFIKAFDINFYWSYDGLWAEEKISREKLKLVKQLTNFCSVQIGPPNLNIVDNYLHYIKTLKMIPTFTVMKDTHWNMEDVDKFRYEFRALCVEASKYIMAGHNYLPKVIYMALKRLIEGTENKTSYPWCGAGEKMEALMPDGEVYPCARFGTEKFKSSKIEFSECGECDIDYFCDKGCYHQVVKNNGVLKEVCEVNRIIYNCVIEMNNSLKNSVEWGKIVVQADKEARCIE